MRRCIDVRCGTVTVASCTPRRPMSFPSPLWPGVLRETTLRWVPSTRSPCVTQQGFDSLTRALIASTHLPQNSYDLALPQWAYSRGHCDSGSLLRLTWSADGTHVAGAGASGAVVFAHVVERRVEWANFVAVLDEHNRVKVTDLLNDSAVTPLL